jgi:hypothetical protein
MIVIRPWYPKSSRGDQYEFTALRLPVKRVSVVVASSLCRVCRVCRVCRLYGGVQRVLRRSWKVTHGMIVDCEVPGQHLAGALDGEGWGGWRLRGDIGSGKALGRGENRDRSPLKRFDCAYCSPSTSHSHVLVRSWAALKLRRELGATRFHRDQSGSMTTAASYDPFRVAPCLIRSHAAIKASS